jgi:dTDP-4-dehydrorhamnose 3,5-epimerase
VVLDVVVDLRPESVTYGEHVSVVLSAENQRQFCTRGFTWFCGLRNSNVFYKCDNFTIKNRSGLKYNDPALQIDWKFSDADLLISDKDQILPNLDQAKCVW